MITKNAIEAYHDLTNDGVAKIKKQTYDGLIDFAEYT
jgi:hypothetical protein